MNHRNYIVFDCETGGLDPSANPITEIALKVIEPLKFKELNKYSHYIKPYNNFIIEEEALRHSMVKRSDIMSKGRNAKEVVLELIEILRETNKSGRDSGRPILVGHNVGFDIDFLSVLFHLMNKSLSDYVSSTNFGDIRRIDTCSLAEMKWEGVFKSDESKSYTLESCCKRMNIDLVDAHGAMNDVNVTTKLFIKFAEELRVTKFKGESAPESEVVKEKIKFEL